MRRVPADLLLISTVVIWGANFSAVRYAVTHGFEPLAYSGFRFGLGALLFAGITYGREGTLRMRQRDLWLLAGSSAAGIWLNNIAFMYAITKATAATIALLYGTMPIFVMLLSRLFGLERLRARFLLAAAISFAGVALVAFGTSGGLKGELGGVLLGLVTPLLWAIFSVSIAPVMRRYSAYRVSAITLLAGGLPLVASGAPQLASEDWGGLGGLAWGAFLYSLIFSLLVTNLLWFTAIDRVGPSRSSLYVNLQPFFGAFFGLVLLSESMSTLQVAGGLIIGAGLVLARRTQAAGAPPE